MVPAFLKSMLQELFECQNCGAQNTKWAGRCTECQKWGTLIKKQRTIDPHAPKKTEAAYSPAKTTQLKDIKDQGLTRIITPIAEFNRVLGGGIVPGSFILLGGEPGIGKSTLALQLAATISKTLYISGEESVAQIKLRADRLGLNAPTLSLANESNVEIIGATLQAEKPTLLIIDSIQTIASAEIEGEAGSVTQVRAATIKLLEIAKSTNTPVILIGHVTKEGTVAGPKTLEHLVDTVLYLEGDRHHFFRILRTVKNRFGATDEVGIFEMKEKGLEEVQNPSASFVAERASNLPGTVLTCLLEGTRPILVEIQALVSKTAFGYPTRKASGFDINRLHVLIAVLQKRAGLALEQYDIHLNIVGGLDANEPAADLAVCLAIASAYKDKPLGTDLAAFGEVGLGGEVRSISQLEKRVKECEQLGLKRAITHFKQTKDSPKILSESKKIKCLNVNNLQDLITHT